MSQSLANIVVHLVFSTKGRRPLLRDEDRGQLHAYITGILKNLESPLIEINSVRDHVHVLFAQFNVFAGYRFPRRRAELTVGLLNIADQDYRLNPLNLHADLARERTLTVNFKFNF